jgi:hypothetical protein
MRRNKLYAAGLALLLVMLLAGAVYAGSAGYAVGWRVMAGGGQKSVSAQYQVQGTFGQLAIGPAQGAHQRLGAGYWYGVGKGERHPLFLPYVHK